MDMKKKYASNKRWNDKNKEKIRSISKSWYERNKKRKYETNVLWKKNNREKLLLQKKKYRELARVKLWNGAVCKANYAIRTGKMVKKNECEKCGISRGVQMHHEDYSKPLDVIFLCRACHLLIHK